MFLTNVSFSDRHKVLKLHVDLQRTCSWFLLDPEALMNYCIIIIDALMCDTLMNVELIVKPAAARHSPSESSCNMIILSEE